MLRAALRAGQDPWTRVDCFLVLHVDLFRIQRESNGHQSLTLIRRRRNTGATQASLLVKCSDNHAPPTDLDHSSRRHESECLPRNNLFENLFCGESRTAAAIPVSSEVSEVAVGRLSARMVFADAGAFGAEGGGELKKNRFLSTTREVEDLNQYWYSNRTITHMALDVEEVCAAEGTRAAFLSTPSVYFSLSKEVSYTLYPKPYNSLPYSLL